MFCKQCGNSIDPDRMHFCSRCGWKVPEELLRKSRTTPGGSPANRDWRMRTPQGNHTTTMAIEVGSRRRAHTATPGSTLTITALCGDEILDERDVSLTHPAEVSFGSDPSCDLHVGPHDPHFPGQLGMFAVRNGICMVHDLGSPQGLLVNGMRQPVSIIAPGDVINIVGTERLGGMALLVGDSATRWESFSLKGRNRISVGRSADNDLVIAAPTVSAHQAMLTQEPTGLWRITDLNSYNGTFVNGRSVRSSTLAPGSRIMFGNIEYLLLGSQLLSLRERSGVDVFGENLVRYRKIKGKTRVTTDHITLRIKRGEFVAIVGGSGSGKSTLLNELNGSEFADEGSVYIDGVSLYPNYQTLKSSIGYVPQQDIVYDNLTLTDMLDYAARLRMPADMTAAERQERCNEVIKMLDLEIVRDNLIGNMSGGQKKRASIAVELLADPRLLFLDEPTSGLDPGIEQQLMETLARMAHDGRTIILVTHTTQNLHLCDQLVILGQGGKLCYAGRPDGAPDFFGVSDLISIYNKVGENPEGWQQYFASHRNQVEQATSGPAAEGTLRKAKLPPFGKQLATLSSRYGKLLINDRSRLALLVLQAPFLAALISFVAGNDCFDLCEPTKSCLFALSCAAFWVGILDAIQEICKERAIFKREYEGGVRVGAYVASKVLILSLLCLLQSGLLTGTFCAMMRDRIPTHALISAPFELFVAMTLITLSAMCLGLLVSALFNNPDRAIAMAPLLIMPQILFSGLVFELKGATENVSYLVNCRWGMEALGTTANLNALDLKIYGTELEIPDFTYTVPHIEVDTDYGTVEEDNYETEVSGLTGIIGPEGESDTGDSDMIAVPYEHEQDDMFTHTLPHLLFSWAILAVFCLVCGGGCLFTLVMQTRAAQKVPRG